MFYSDPTSDTNSSKGDQFGYPIMPSEANDVIHFDVPDDSLDVAPPSRYPGDPAVIARHIFRDELADVLKVLRACGLLHDHEDKLWCLRELARLLDELCPGNRA
jgi:hypothetical protein